MKINCPDWCWCLCWKFMPVMSNLETIILTSSLEIKIVGWVVVSVMLWYSSYVTHILQFAWNHQLKRSGFLAPYHWRKRGTISAWEKMESICSVIFCIFSIIGCMTLMKIIVPYLPTFGWFFMVFMLGKYTLRPMDSMGMPFYEKPPRISVRADLAGEVWKFYL